MTWPLNPRDVSEIPHYDWEIGNIASMHPVAADGLLRAMPLIAHSLEAVTGGNERAEKALGGVLIKLAEQVGAEAFVRMGR